MNLTKDLKEKISRGRWFHSIDFGSFATSGRFPAGSPQNVTLFGAFGYLEQLSLKNCSVLDIGTQDGLIAYGCHSLGASKVFAVDWSEKKEFLIARSLLGLDDRIDYRANGVQISDLKQMFFQKQYFDIIVNAGVFYHMLNPFKAFSEPRSLLSNGGLMILETAYHKNESAALFVNNSEHLVNEPWTYFVPTINALIGMAYLSSFKVLSISVLENPNRVTLLLKACSSEELMNDKLMPPYTRQMILRDFIDKDFKLRDLNNRKSVPTAPENLSTNSSIQERYTINAATWQTNFPHHNKGGAKEVLGSTYWETTEGNTLKL